MQTSTLRPGLLVALSTTITGNVSYRRREIAPDHITDQGTKEASWQTDRTIFDPVEDERARVVRSKARSIITAVCSRSAFGMLCPEDNARNLEAAIGEARALADDFNASASLSRVGVYVLTGRIAPDDVEAVKAINSEIRDLIDAMADGVARLDVDAVRDAANKARQVSGMLTEGARERVAVAIKTARDAARKIVSAGEQAAQEIDKQAIRKIAEARTAFLDIEDTPADVAAPSVESRAIDLDPDYPEMGAAPFTPSNSTPKLDF
jgi:hypothetical protein